MTEKELATRKGTNMGTLPTWARDLWLAGLGSVAGVEEKGSAVLGTVTEQGKSVIEKLQSEADTLFKQLIKRGQGLEQRGRERIDVLLADVTKRGEETRTAFDRMVTGIAEDTLNQIDMPTRTEVRSLADKVRTLTTQVDELSARLIIRPAADPAILPALYEVRNGEAGWMLVAEGEDQPVGVFATKVEAVDSGRQQAKSNNPSRLLIYRKDGSVQEDNSYDL